MAVAVALMGNSKGLMDENYNDDDDDNDDKNDGEQCERRKGRW